MSGPANLADRCGRLVAELGLVGAGGVAEVRPLTGGVASDIAMVDLGDRRVCVKFALARLKVAEEWRAPVHRNRAEYDWLRAAAAIRPDGALRLYGRSEGLMGFAMEYLEGDGIRLWKADLLAGAAPEPAASAVADLLGAIHAASTAPGFDRAPFHNRDDFHALRIEPYLRFTATRAPALAARLNDLADRLYASEGVLVHGDVSPKNIILRDGRPILLDAECATLGDPAFDVAFCLNHLVLKAVYLPASRTALLDAVGSFWRAYAAHVTWEPPAELEGRIAALLPALMLARIDGKSPVEYLGEDGRRLVRSVSTPLVAEPEPDLARFVAALDLDRQENPS